MLKERIRNSPFLKNFFTYFCMYSGMSGAEVFEGTYYECLDKMKAFVKGKKLLIISIDFRYVSYKKMQAVLHTVNDNFFTKAIGMESSLQYKTMLEA